MIICGFEACICKGITNCIVLYLYIYIALPAVHTNQKHFQCERPREKRMYGSVTSHSCNLFICRITISESSSHHDIYGRVAAPEAVENFDLYPPLSFDL